MELPRICAYVFTFFHSIIQRLLASLTASFFDPSIYIIEHF